MTFSASPWDGRSWCEVFRGGQIHLFLFLSSEQMYIILLKKDDRISSWISFNLFLMYIKIYAKPPLPEENDDDASFNLFSFPRKQILEFVCNSTLHVFQWMSQGLVLKLFLFIGLISALVSQWLICYLSALLFIHSLPIPQNLEIDVYFH